MGVQRGTSILIVDDDLASLGALAEILSGEGYMVSTAATGREAIEILRDSPDLRLMILDLIIPDVNGFQLLERRSHETGLARVPVIAMSGCDERVNVEAQVRKPVNVHILLKLIKLLAPEPA